MNFAELVAAGRRPTRLEGPDWRSEPRRAVDRVWAKLKAACIEKHGKAPSVDPRAQPTDETAVLLGRAQDAEAAFIRTAMMAGMTAASVDAAFDDLASAIVGWANAATRGWVSAKQHAKRLEAEQSIREGGPGPIGGPADVWGPR